MASDFSAMISRMKYIERWALMRNSRSENISEHSLETGMLAHMLAVIGNVRLGKKLNAERAALLGMYHDCTEIITGDMPTPVKYYNHEIRDAYRQVEDAAAHQLLALLPEDLQTSFTPIFFPQEEDDYLWKLVKAADVLSALIKCMEEEKAGSREFSSARISTEEKLKNMEIPELVIFMEEFLPAYEKTLDEIGLSGH